MKQLLLICAIVFATVSFSQAQASLGGGLAYGTEVDEVGVIIDGEFFLKNNVSLSPDFIVYFVDDGANFKNGFWEFNANGHFYFNSSQSAALYGLAGLNLSTSTYKPDGGDRDSNSELGLNLGIGSNFDVNASFEPFAEFKFTIGDFDQAVFMFGLHFDLH